MLKWRCVKVVTKKPQKKQELPTPAFYFLHCYREKTRWLVFLLDLFYDEIQEDQLNDYFYIHLRKDGNSATGKYSACSNTSEYNHSMFLADQPFPLNRRGPGDALLVDEVETREKGARSANYQEKKMGRKRIKKRGEKRCFLRVGDCFFDIKTCFLYVFPPRKSLVLGL